MQRTGIIKRSHSTNSITEEFGNERWIDWEKYIQQERLTAKVCLVWYLKGSGGLPV